MGFAKLASSYLVKRPSDWSAPLNGFEDLRESRKDFLADPAPLIFEHPGGHCFCAVMCGTDGLDDNFAGMCRNKSANNHFAGQFRIRQLLSCNGPSTL